MYNQIRHTFKRSIFVLLVAFLLLLAGCNATKYVPDGKYMLNKVNIQVDDDRLSKDELKAHVKQKGNLRILGIIKFHLGLYNMSSPKRENDWFKRIGEAPVIYEEYQTQRSIDQMNVYLRNKGFYNAVIIDSLVVHPRKPKVDQVYRLIAGDPYNIRNFSIECNDKAIKLAVNSDSLYRKKETRIFDVDALNTERNRVVRMLKNQGYYSFSEDFISYEADTMIGGKNVDVVMKIDDVDPDPSVFEAHKRYRVNHFFVRSDFTPARLLAETEAATDTVVNGNYTFLYSSKPNYRRILFKNLNRIPDSTYFCLDNVEKTYRSLNRLRQFKVINIGFTESDSVAKSGEGLLDCSIQLSPLPRQGLSVDLEGTNSSGNFGVAGNLNVQHRNVFHGAEVLDFRIRGAMERQQTTLGGGRLDFNTREFGLETGLTIPKFLSFIGRERMFGFQIPQTKISLGYNYQRRPDYTRTISTLRMGYHWKTSDKVTQTFNLLDFNYVNLSEFNEEFINSIQDFYIKSSFTDHLISATNYTRVFNNQDLNRNGNYKYVKLNIESAGNLLGLYATTIGKDKRTEIDSKTKEEIRYYEVLKTRFAQYIRADIEYRYSHRIDQFNSVVARAFAGAGLPYGNFDVLPFEKKYFTGGANGIRAWQVRTLGPGKYVAPANVYPNQLSDIKLEANLEYRFRLLFMTEGALFLDAGNIWAINSKDNREGAVFKIGEFYNQIAVGTGFGLRFDFKYFLFRLDIGMKLRDPSLSEGRRWIPGNEKIDADKFNLSFAIGYPF